MKYEFEQEYKKIGLKIAYYRKLAGLTQEMLAEKLDVATSYIGQIEAVRMYKPISLTTLLRIAQALNTPAYKFLKFQDSVSSKTIVNLPWVPSVNDDADDTQFFIKSDFEQTITIHMR